MLNDLIQRTEIGKFIMDDRWLKDALDYICPK